MIYHSNDINDLKSLPEYYQQAGRERGAAAGVYHVNGDIRFCFVFRAFGNLEMAAMPFDDNPGDFLKVCKSIHRRLGRDKTVKLLGEGLQWIKRSKLDCFEEMVLSDKYSNSDWTFYDSVIYLHDKLGGKHISRHQQYLQDNGQLVIPSNQIAKNALSLRMRLADKILHSEKDIRLVHLSYCLKEASIFFQSHSGVDDDSHQFALHAGIVSGARYMIDTTPDEWYPTFESIAPKWSLPKHHKNYAEFAQYRPTA